MVYYKGEEIDGHILNNGYKIPIVGLGTWQMTSRKELLGALETAYLIGYRHIDTASIYENERIIGSFVKGKPRSTLFLTTKLWITDHAFVREACEKSMHNLGTDYLDLYLIHFPPNKTFPFNLKLVWEEMEALVDRGLVRSIGVSNFGPKKLKEVLSFCRIKPSVNQIELHPYLPQDEICKICEMEGIRIVSYSTLGSSGTTDLVREDPLVCSIAKKYGVTPSKVLLSYAVGRGCCVIPRSKSAPHQRDNFHLLDLPEADMAALQEITKRKRYVAGSKFGPDVFD